MTWLILKASIVASFAVIPCRGADGCRMGPVIQAFVVLVRLLAIFGLSVLASPVLASDDGQVFFRRKSNRPAIDRNTLLKPVNCRTAADGEITCDVQIVNPPNPDLKYRTEGR